MSSVADRIVALNGAAVAVDGVSAACGRSGPEIVKLVAMRSEIVAWLQSDEPDANPVAF
jgi:hypothetical protein